MNIAESDASTYPSLKSAKQLLQQKVQGFFSDPNTLEKLHGIFPGATAGAGDEWRTNAQGLINNILSNRYAIDVELLSNTEMAGAMGAFAGVGYNGKPVIYINADWLSLNPDSTFVSRVLAEEFGHSLDFSLNSTQDTAGDEGFKFALELFGSEGIDTSRLEADDHETLRVHGAEILVEEASVTFQAAYMGTPSAWSLEASSIKLTSKVNAILNGIKFISGDPNAQYFSGNNVAGSLVYSNSSGTVYTINGIISRQFKSGATTNAFYFYATGANGVVDSNGGDDSAYLLHVVGNSTTIVYDGTSNASYTTSSDPVDTALNNIKDSTQPSLTATTSSTAGALPAIEAGGTANSTAGQDGSGNVITGLYTNFTGTNPPTIISAGVTAASQTAVAAISTSTSNFTAIIANFGTLQIGANGTYLYKVDNTNTSVQGLRQLTDTLTDTFTYTAKDDNGYIASTTLTVTIQGKNDAPVASNDYATAKATLSSVPLADQYTSNDPYGMLATGNVLTNDSDVDKYGETKSVVGLTATATYANAYTPGGSTTKLVFSAASTLSNVSATSSQYVYISNGATPTPTYYLLKNSGTAITVSSNTKNADGTYSINLSKTPDNYTLGNGSVVMFSTTNTPDFTTNTSGKKIATVSTSTSVQSSTVTVTTTDGTIYVGMSITGTNIPSGATVTNITPSGSNFVLTIDKLFSSAPSGTFTLSSIGGNTVNGLYGILVLNSDGTYTYTPTADTPGGTENFKYSMRDAASLLSTATLTVNVLPSVSTDPNAKPDAVTGIESGGTNNGTPGTNPSGNVISGSIFAGNGSGGVDAVGSGATAVTVTAGRTSSASSSTAITAGSYQDFTGAFGTLRLNSNGNYTYTINMSNSQVEALNALDSVSEIFYYTITNNASPAKTDTSTLTVTISGANDATVLKLNASGSATNFTSSYTPTYTINSTTVTAVPAPLVSNSGAYITDVDNAFFFKLTLSYTQANFADGISEQLLINGASGSNPLISSLGNLTNASTGSFTLNSLGYSYTTIVSNGVATISFTASAANTALSQAQIETLLTAFRYQNTSSTPTSGSGRIFTIATFDNGANNSTTLANSGNLSSNNATSTITVYSTSTAPSATADTVTAVEAGTTAGTDPTGNVLTGQTSNNTGTNIGDSGAGITVTKVQPGSSITGSASTVTANSTSSRSPTNVNGNYGTLTIGSDGSYSYTVDNTNSTVDALTPGQSITDIFAYQITDTSNNTATSTLTVTINGANDSANAAPVVTTSANATQFTEGNNVTSTPVAVDSGITVTDADNNTLASATVTITSNFQSSEDVLGLVLNSSTMGNITASYASGVLTLISSGATATVAQWQAALQAITYTNTSQTPNTSTRTISFVVNDGTSNSNTATKDVSVTAVNDAPVVTTTSGTTPFTEGNNVTSTPVAVDSGITITDAENNTLASATVTITSNFQSSEDVLGLVLNSSTMGNITASYASGVLTLTSSGATATLAQWEAALRAVTYTNTSQTPNTSTRTISFVVNDGTSNSNTATKNVSVASTNDTPVVTTTNGATQFIEGNNATSTPVAVDSGITVTDADSNTLASATVSITNNYHSGEDTLGFTNTNSTTFDNISATYNSGTGVLTLTSSGATATLAQWEAALRAVTYTNTSQTPNTSTRTISFVVNDGNSNSNTATKDVSVTAVNDTPVVNAPAVIQVIEDVITVLTGISFSDQDAGSGQVTANFAVPSGTLYATSGGVTVLGSGTGNLTLSGSVADINTFIASNNFSFQTTPNNTATVTLTIGINDNGNSGGSAQTNSTTVNLQVISVADVINVTSPTANGHYKAGDVITVTVQFDEPVFVNTSGGIPDLVLETGTIDRNAVYTSGSGTSTLTFTYTVQPGDTTPDLDYVSSISLGLNGGTIQNNTAINATLSLPNPGTTGSLGANKEIVIDTTPPSVGPIDITNGTDSGTNDTITNNGSPVIIFTGETGLTISLLGADGSILLTPVTQYTVIETPNGNGTSTYTVTLLDANGNLNDGNQPFGTYLTTFPNIGNPTNNGGSVADGIYTIKATDIAGNQSTVGTFTIDTTPPGLSPGVGPINITNGTDSGPDDTITNNGNPVLTFTGEQGLTITLYGPDGTQLIFGTHYTFSYTSGTYTVNLLDAVPGGQANTFGSFNNGAPTGNLPSVADGLYTIKATDVAGNQSTVGTFTIDTTAPSVVVTSNLSTLVSNQTATITFTFSENPIGFTNTDVIVNGGTISGFTSTADPKVYSGIFTPSPNSTANGTISVSIGSYTDLANNPGASDSTSIMVDTLGPSLAISSDKPELEYHQTAAITFSFSELPVGFDLVDITLTGGTLSNLKASPINQTIYTALFNPTIDFIGDGLISVANGRFTDSLGNLGTGGNISPAINIFNKIRGFTATGDNSSFVGPELGNSSSSDGTSVVLYNPSTGESRGNVVPFPGYTGQVRISRADTNNDSILDMVVSPDAGYAPLVKIIDSSNGSTIAQFNAYDRNFTGGLYVSVADVNNDGFAEIITGAGFGGGPHVKVFDGKTHNEVASFFAYDLNFRGGVSVATFDFDRDGILDIVTGAGPGGGPHVKVFNGANMQLMKEFMAYAIEFTGGVYVAAGDFMSDGRYEIITGAGAGGGPHVKVWDYETLNLVAERMVYDNFTYSSGLVIDILFGGGARVGLADGNNDGIDDIITGAGAGGGPHVKVLAGLGLQTVRNFFSGEETDSRGVFVGH